MKHVRAVLAVILAALPFVGRAADPQPAAPAAAEAAPAPAQPAPEQPKPPPPAKVTLDVSGWFSLDTFYDDAPFNDATFPRWAQTKDLSSSTATKMDDSQMGFQVRQTRLRANIGLPNDSIGGAVTKGYIEGDFSGAAGADISAWIPRLRHAYVSATWKELANMTVLVGQYWGIAPGPYATTSITHIVVPRFAGAGFLYRRAPQVRLSGDLPVAPDAGVNLNYAAAAVTPDNANGEKTATPNFEGRLAGQYKMGGKQVVDLGVFGHFGKEKWATYELTGTAPTTTAAASGTKTLVTKDLNSQAIGVDLKLDVPYVSILAQFYSGKNLDNYYTISPGVVSKTATDTTDTACGTIDASGYCTAAGQVTRKPNKVVVDVTDVSVKGYVAQAVITPVQGLALVGGYGVEQPDKDTLAGLTTTATTGAERIVKNAQISGAILVNLNPKWRIGLEYTRYMTDYEYKPKGAAATDPVLSKTFSGDQIELGSLYNF